MLIVIGDAVDARGGEHRVYADGVHALLVVRHVVDGLDGDGAVEPHTIALHLEVVGRRLDEALTLSLVVPVGPYGIGR